MDNSQSNYCLHILVLYLYMVTLNVNGVNLTRK